MELKIIVTGGLGFIGSNLINRLLKDGYEVVVIDNFSRKGSEKNLEWLNSQWGTFKVYNCDIRWEDDVKKIFKELGSSVKAVYHLAGQVAVTTSVENPRDDFECNAIGTFNVIEGIRQFCPDAMVAYSSTNKVYGGMEGVTISLEGNRYVYQDLPYGVDEKRNLDFHSPYGCSKGAADQYMVDYQRIYGLNTFILRQSCIYGYRQFGIEDQGWVAWFIIASILGKPITIYGDGKQIRDVLFIDDLIDLYVKLLQNGSTLSEQVFNIGGGPDNTLSLLELLQQLEGLLGREIPISYEGQRPGDQKVFVADIRQANEVLGWQPKINPEQGVAKLFAWVNENKHLF